MSRTKRYISGMVESGNLNRHLEALTIRNMKRGRMIMEATAPIVNDSARTLEARQAASNANVFGFSAWALYQRGRPANADTFLAFAEQWLTSLILPEAELGAAMIEGRKKPKHSALARLVDDALGALGERAPAKDVLHWIQVNHDGKVIQEIENDPEGPITHWRARNGREMKTAFKRFQSLVSERRKKI